MEVPLLQQLTVSISLFFVALVVRGVFAFLETTITALRLFKIKEMAHASKRYENIFHTLEKNPHRILITILIISSFADVICAAAATNIMETVFQHFNLSSNMGFTLGIGFAGIMIIIFGEILPKNLARSRSESIFQSLIWLINAAYYGLYPVVSLLIYFSDAIINIFSGKNTQEGKGEWVSSEQEIRFLIDYIHDKGIMEKEKTEMLRNIFDLGRITVKDVMVPATDIILVDVNTPLTTILELLTKHPFTRLPVYEETMDNIIGMVHLKDVFHVVSKKEQMTLRELIRPILFVPESLKISQLLREFREQMMHIAIVLNEHGSVIGLITLEDVLEEIVGEISDEHESSHEKILKLQQGGWLVDASITLESISHELNVSFETKNSITLGGFLTEKLQHLPKKGDRVLYKHYYFQIQKASPKRVQQVLVFEEKDNPEE